MRRWTLTYLALLLVFTIIGDNAAGEIRVRVKIDRGTDLGQCFGSLFEARTSDGSLAVGAQTGGRGRLAQLYVAVTCLK